MATIEHIFLYCISKFPVFKIDLAVSSLTLKGLGGDQFDPRRPCILSRKEALLFCDFQYYHKSNLSRKFHWNFSSHSDDMKKFFLHYKLFLPIFQVFLHFLVTKKLMTWACNRWNQHFFYFQTTSNRVFHSSVKLYWH